MSRKKTTLLISPFFYPEPVSTGKYNTHLAKGLVQQGRQVDVLCSHPIYPQWKPAVSNKTMCGINIIRGGRFIRYPASPLLRRLVLEVWFFFFVVRHLLPVWFRRKHYDSIIFIFPPNLVGLLAFLIPQKNTRITGIVHDIQGVMANSRASLPRKLVMKMIHAIERRSYQACDKLIFLSENMQKTAQRLYGKLSSESAICYPFITLPPDTKASHQLDDIFGKYQYSLVYSGALGEKQAPDKLAELFLSVITKAPEIHAFIFSQGAVFNQLKSRYSHPQLHFHPFVDKSQLPELLNRSSVQVIPQQTGTSDGAFPSKLPNILASHGKVFTITDRGSELDRLLQQYTRALVCYSWEDNQLADQLIHFVKKENSSLLDEDENLIQTFSLTKLLDEL